MAWNRSAVLCGVAALAACAGPQRYAGSDPVAFTLGVWVDDHPLLVGDDALAACREWRSKGVDCRLQADRADGDVLVFVNDGPCVEDAEGFRTLALAYPDGHIEFFRRCFLRGDGSYDRHMFRGVMTHEIGHEIGIWPHVPDKCGDEAARSPKGPVCGIAVMNRLYDDDVTFVTVVDARAFDVRDADNTALVPAAFSARGGADAGPWQPACIYRGR